MPNVLRSDSVDLGVEKIQLSFRYWTVKGKRNVTGEGPGTLWLRRVGGHQAGPHALPYQHQDAIRGFLWLWHSNPDDSVTFIKPCLYVHLPVSYDWRPRLRLVVMSESGDGFDTVEAVVHYEASEDPQWSELYTWRNIRPISFTFKLPPGAGNCFKVYDESFPGVQHAFCLPPRLQLCARLAPPERFTPELPALWSLMAPLREAAPPADPQAQYGKYATWLAHYMSYQVDAMGQTGVLLYDTAVGHELLRRQPLLQPYLREGTLRLVLWDLPDYWTSSKDVHTGYNGIRWDQSLVNSHALLGLSACGPNLYLYIADVDELLYTQVGKPWPAPVACLNGKSSSSGSSSGSSSKSKSSRRQLGSGGGLLLAEGGLARGPPGIFNLRRKSIVASGVEPEEEAVLWVTPPQGVDERGRRAAGRDGWKRGGQEAMAAHPLAKYDRIAVEAANVQHGKNIAIPARYVVSYFVHDGYPLQGSIVVPPEECLVVMHVEQHARTREAYIQRKEFTNFTNWVFHNRNM